MTHGIASHSHPTARTGIWFDAGLEWADADRSSWWTTRLTTCPAINPSVDSPSGLAVCNRLDERAKPLG